MAVIDRFTATLWVLSNDGTGAFEGTGSAATGADPRSLVGADLDGDGDLDLAMIDHNRVTVSVLLNDGTGAFTAGGGYFVSCSPPRRSGRAIWIWTETSIWLAGSGVPTGGMVVLANDGTGVSRGRSASGGPGPTSRQH